MEVLATRWGKGEEEEKELKLYMPAASRNGEEREREEGSEWKRQK